VSPTINFFDLEEARKRIRELETERVRLIDDRRIFGDRVLTLEHQVVGLRRQLAEKHAAARITVEGFTTSLLDAVSSAGAELAQGPGPTYAVSELQCEVTGWMETSGPSLTMRPAGAADVKMIAAMSCLRVTAASLPTRSAVADDK